MGGDEDDRPLSFLRNPLHYLQVAVEGWRYVICLFVRAVPVWCRVVHVSTIIAAHIESYWVLLYLLSSALLCFALLCFAALWY